jgi:HEAT repeat protein
MGTRRLLALALASLLFGATSDAQDLKKALKSKDVKVRLEAVETLRKQGGEDCEELLLDALSDRDWEVVEEAAKALAERGGEDSVKPLVKTAVLGPVRRIRLAAARSLRRIAPEVAAESIAKRVTGDWAEAAAEALSELATSFESEELRKGLKRGLAAEDIRVRVAAVRGVARLGSSERKTLLRRVFEMKETSVRATALDTMRERAGPDDLELVAPVFRARDLNDVLDRRAVATVHAIVASVGPGEEADRLGRKALFGYELAKDAKIASRFARLAGILAAAPPLPEEEGATPPRPLVLPEQVEEVLEFALTHKHERVRSAGVHALGRIRIREGIDRAAKLAKEDRSARVRLHALRTVVGARGMVHGETFALVCDRLSSDADAMLRAEAAVFLGIRDRPEAAAALIPALKDKSWEVAVCAAVSLGKTGDVTAIEPLRSLLKNRDAKLRGAGIVGCGHLQQKAVVTDVIEALGDRDAAVKRTAYEFLRRMTSKEIEPRVKPWKEWWKEVEKNYRFIDRDEAAREARKHGYAPTDTGVYEDLDVIVLQSRGDHIEQLLARLSIVHRLTRSGQVPAAGVHPFAVFVSNCTGQIVPKDVAQLRWFVLTGGYLFCSCWALSYTIEPAFPGAVRKLPINSEILDNVIAEECPTESPYLTGVFPDEHVRPIYVLYGSHLIEVLDHERVEVLIDSPDCADRWGEGNLACWFTAGHGVVLDSANHFDLQGLERADGVSSADERMAYAMDHMGLTYEDLRTLAKKKVWGSGSKSAAEARDLSAFRFITNFVRHKRKVDR